MSTSPTSWLTLVEPLRPELHRYAARLTGSVIDGEDIVQDALARALAASGSLPELPPLRPWLFRITHNVAVDLLKSHGRARTEPVASLDDRAPLDEAEVPDVLALRLALSCFVSLPVQQRSAVVLRDVLGHSNEEAAQIMDTTVMAVKAALVRGRAALRALEGERPTLATPQEEALRRYADLFNARDWDGLRDMVSDDCRLDLVSKARRQGAAVREYFGRYEKEDVSLRLGRLEGRRVLVAYEGPSDAPAYVVLMDFSDGRVADIRDYRYARYVVAEAELEVEG